LKNSSIISNEAEKLVFIEKMKSAVIEKPILIETSLYKKDRSLAQNRLSFLWYKAIAEHNNTTTASEQNTCKLEYGCPILVETDTEFANVFNKAIRPLNYEDRVSAMKYMPATRLLSVKQMAHYLQQIETDWAHMGLSLPVPEDLYNEAIGRK